MPLDPYYQWLGIPPAEQPPDHYRLLGLRQFEADANVIENAADRQMAHVRTFQGGPHMAQSQKLLNELAAARRCLTVPDQKSKYDEVLRRAAPADLSPATASAKPRTVAIGPYQVVERLSASALGVTYKVRHQKSGRFYSLKALPSETAKKDEVRQRFRREVEVLTRLDHPNLIRGIEAGEHGGVPYLVTEFVLGADLASLVEHQGTLSVEQAVTYVAQTALGLSQLHQHGVVHRNLKPQVLLVDVQGQIKITNLLLAKIHEESDLEAGERLTVDGLALGTVDYMAPEQARAASDVDGRADLYALGCTLHFLLTGQPPYPGKSFMEKMLAHVQGQIPSLCAAHGDVPPGLDRVFAKLLAKDAKYRYATAEQFLDDLGRI